MSEFSIEKQAENIYDNRTRENFKEVLSCFIHNNNRSAIVMLWSVVVTDLVYKLQDLHHENNNKKAKEILDEIKSKQDSNSKDSEWEIDIVKKFFNDLKFYEASDYQNLCHLQKMRHLSAHPVLKATLGDILHKPNKDEVRSCLRNALEAVLLKPPILNSEIKDIFLEDMTRVSDLIKDNNELTRYITSKYLIYFNDSIKEKLIKMFWKFCFNLDNKETKSNRNTNIRVLLILINLDVSFFKGIILNNKKFFSNISSSKEILRYLNAFLFRKNFIYNMLDDSARLIINSFLTANKSHSYLSAYRFENYEEYFQDLTANFCGYIDEYNFRKIIEIAKDNFCLEKALRLGIFAYSQAQNFDTADELFSVCIRDYLDDYNTDLFNYLLKEASENSQAYYRNKASKDHKLVIEKMLEKSITFDSEGESKNFFSEVDMQQLKK